MPYQVVDLLACWKGFSEFWMVDREVNIYGMQSLYAYCGQVGKNVTAVFEGFEQTTMELKMILCSVFDWMTWPVIL